MASFWDKMRNTLMNRKPPRVGEARPSDVAGLPEGYGTEGLRGTPTDETRQDISRFFYAGEDPGVDKHERVAENEGEAFLRGELTMSVASSNVRSAHYHPEENAMTVTFLGKKGKPDTSYRYLNVSLTEANSLLMAGSKGRWVWATLRIRGTKNGHRKPFIRLN